MSWYKIAQQQYLWDNDPELPNANIDRSTIEISGDIIEDINNSKNLTELQSILFNYKIIDIDEVVFEKIKEKYWVFDYDDTVYLIHLSFPYPSLEKGDEWIYGIGENAWQYLDTQDFNEEFWDSVGQGETVYHGTREDKLDEIMRGGIAPMNETRGIDNRSTGAAVFTSPSAEIAEQYYPVVLEINLGQMKADGYMPQASKEGPIEESEQMQLLAYKIGLKDFHAEYEQGLDPETIIFYGNIPAKYLRIVE